MNRTILIMPLLGLVIICLFFLIFILLEKIIIINPAIILRGKELYNKNLPKNVAEAPKIINTIEKPIVNKNIGNKFTLFF